jgi:hypothetical protein
VQTPTRFTLGRFIWTVDRVGDFERVKVKIGVNQQDQSNDGCSVREYYVQC